MPNQVIECPEVAGKTVVSLKLYPEFEGGCEAIIEFTDGTAFSCCMMNKASFEAQYYRPGIGTPEVLARHCG